MRHQCRRRGICAGARHHDGVYPFAPFVVGYADHRALRDIGVLVHGVFDFGGIDVLTAGNDHVLEPVADENEAFLVHVGSVTGMQPAVAQCFAGGVLATPVTEHDVGTAHHDFAHFAARQFVPLLIDDQQFGGGQGATGGAQATTLGSVVARHQRGQQRCRLGLAVELAGRHPRQPGQQVEGDGFGHRRSAIEHALQTTQVEVLEARLFEQHLDHGRHQDDVGHRVVRKRLRAGRRFEARDKDMGAADVGDGIHIQGVGDVEHRCGVQIDGVVDRADHGHVLQGVGDMIAVAQHHALGAAGGAAGIKNAGQAVARVGIFLDLGMAIDQHVMHGVGAGQRSVDADDGQRIFDQFAQGGDQVPEGAIDEQYTATGVAQREGDFRRRPPIVDRHDHAAGPWHGKEDLKMPIGIQSDHRDPLAGRDAEGLKAAGQTRDALGQLAPGATAFTVDGCDAVRDLLVVAAQGLGNSHDALVVCL